ncbi:MAG: hypothetical protein OEY59_08305 [Deltaproteobacteria bacterium]|nr:hypothetical protein [Deltaproteobacteria bacterium]
MSLDIVKVIGDRSLEKYKDPDKLEEEAVAYAGQVKQHKSDPGKIFLRVDPLSSHGLLLEFNTGDIVFAEDVNTVTNKNGTACRIIKIWVKKGSIAIKLLPFVVSDFSDNYLGHYTL